MIDIKNFVLHESQASFCDFAIDNNKICRVEASALGVFRLRWGTPSQFNDTTLSARAQAKRALLLARHETSSIFSIALQENACHLTQGNTAIKVEPSTLTFYRDENIIMQMSVPTYQENDPPHWKVAIKLAPDEAVYGLGRTTDAFNRRGSLVGTDNTQDNYVPLAWSPKGWGIFPHTFEAVQHDIASLGDDYQLTVNANSLDLFIYIGQTSDIFNQFNATVGRTGQLPWHFMGVAAEQVQGQSLGALEEQIKTLEKTGFSIDTLNLATPSAFVFQTDKFQLEWDSERLGDFRQFVANYANAKTCLPVFPGVPVNTPLFEELEERAWLLLNEDQRAYTVMTESGEFGLLDLSHKETYQSWVDRLRQMVDVLSCGLCLSQKIHLPDDVMARNGEQGANLRHFYSLLLEQALFDAQTLHKTPSEAYVRREVLSLNSAKSTGVYLSRRIRHFDDLALLLQEQLSAQASGVIAQWQVLDVLAENESLYLRSLALAIFSAGFSFCASPEYLPTQLSAENQTIAKNLLALRSRLTPYVLGIIEDSVRTGLPVQRMMPLAFPHDQNAHAYSQQYLLGPALLVAPILEKGHTKYIYLPESEAWWDLNTGIRYEGGQVLEYECDESTVPVFGREGYMLCLGPTLMNLSEFNSARILDEVWLFGMPIHNPVVMRNKIRVMQMQGSSYVKGFEGLRILPSEGLEIKRRGAEVRISRER